MDSTTDEKMREAERQKTQENERRSVEWLGWDELTVEQKIERMRDIVKGINVNSHEHRRQLEELGQQMRLHVHDALGRPMMPLGATLGEIVETAARMPDDDWVYF